MPKPYSDDLSYQMRTKAIEQILWRHIQIIPFEMSHDECLELLAPEQHIAILKDAAAVADVTSGENDMEFEVPYSIDGVTGVTAALRMRTHEGHTPPLRPRKPWMQLGSFKEQKKVTDWLEARFVAGRQAATAQYLVCWLQDHCDRGEQVRFLWPCITHLVKLAAENMHGEKVGKQAADWLDKFSEFRSVRSAPRLPPEIRQALQETSTWVTQGALLDHVTPKPSGPVAISFTRAMNFTLGGVMLTRS